MKKSLSKKPATATPKKSSLPKKTDTASSRGSAAAKSPAKKSTVPAQSAASPTKKTPSAKSRQSPKDSEKRQWILNGNVKPLFCDICNAPTPRTFVGEWKPAEHKDEDTPIPETPEPKYWLKCQVCGQVQLFEEWRIQVDRSKKIGELKPEDCVTYTPQGIYVVGDAIYHKALNRIGIVVSKQTTASGSHTIMVEFEGLGTKQFLENVPRPGSSSSDEGDSKKRLKIKRLLKR